MAVEDVEMGYWIKVTLWRGRWIEDGVLDVVVEGDGDGIGYEGDRSSRAVLEG